MQSTHKESNKRVIKNTGFLYLRMVLVMFVTFFTARITLHVLGVEDFGIQNVVAGAVAFLGVLTGTMTSATQRFLAYDLGKRDLHNFQKTFSTIILVFLSICAIILIVGEAISEWLIYDYLVIPRPRLFAAFWTYQFALFTFIISMMTIPYTSACIAYERMDVFGYMSIIESLLKLAVVYVLYISTFDKLITLSILNLFVQCLLFVAYILFCLKRLRGCKLTKYWNTKLIKEILQYTGWNLFGSVSGILCTAGLTILLNLFFGPIVNAAKAIADKVNQVATQFSLNFFQASSPLIIKSYAGGETDYAKKLVCECSKFTYYLMFVISLAIIFVVKEGLAIWLGNNYVTNDMIAFTQLILVYSLISVLEPPLSTIIRATGKIRNYQVSVGIVTLLALPVCYILFKNGFSAISSMVALIVIIAIAHIIRLYIVQIQIGLRISTYFKVVLRPIAIVTLISFALTYGFNNFIEGQWFRIITLPILAILFSISTILLFGLNNSEKTMLLSIIRNKFHKEK